MAEFSTCKKSSVLSYNPLLCLDFPHIDKFGASSPTDLYKQKKKKKEKKMKKKSLNLKDIRHVGLNTEFSKSIFNVTYSLSVFCLFF